ncbi:MAG: hypothetical protein ACPF9D_12475, partial [Owenweeksia sp.]
TIFVQQDYPINLDLGRDTTFCETETYTLDALIESFPVKWEDGSTGRYREVTKTGTYWARVRNSCGTFYDTVEVKF